MIKRKRRNHIHSIENWKLKGNKRREEKLNEHYAQYTEENWEGSKRKKKVFEAGSRLETFPEHFFPFNWTVIRSSRRVDGVEWMGSCVGDSNVASSFAFVWLIKDWQKQNRGVLDSRIGKGWIGGRSQTKKGKDWVTTKSVAKGHKLGERKNVEKRKTVAGPVRVVCLRIFIPFFTFPPAPLALINNADYVGRGEKERRPLMAD